jgi:hypothetical protein
MTQQKEILQLNDQKNVTLKCYTVIILFNTKYSKIYLKQTLRLNYHQKLKVKYKFCR